MGPPHLRGDCWRVAALVRSSPAYRRNPRHPGRVILFVFSVSSYYRSSGAHHEFPTWVPCTVHVLQCVESAGMCWICIANPAHPRVSHIPVGSMGGLSLTRLTLPSSTAILCHRKGRVTCGSGSLAAETSDWGYTPGDIEACRARRSWRLPTPHRSVSRAPSERIDSSRGDWRRRGRRAELAWRRGPARFAGISSEVASRRGVLWRRGPDGHASLRLRRRVADGKSDPQSERGRRQTNGRHIFEEQPE